MFFVRITIEIYCFRRRSTKATPLSCTRAALAAVYVPQTARMISGGSCAILLTPRLVSLLMAHVSLAISKLFRCFSNDTHSIYPSFSCFLLYHAIFCMFPPFPSVSPPPVPSPSSSFVFALALLCLALPRFAPFCSSQCVRIVAAAGWSSQSGRVGGGGGGTRTRGGQTARPKAPSSAPKAARLR